jgi:integrase
VVKTLGSITHRDAVRKGALLRAQLLHAAEIQTLVAGVGHLKQLPKPPTLSLRTVYEQWCDSRPLAQDTKNACGRAVKLYEKHLGNPPLNQLTRAQGIEFRKWLRNQDTSSKTAKDRMNWIRLLLTFATQDLEAISRNPWAGLEIQAHVTTPRQPWSKQELVSLFSDPIWQRGQIPTARIAGGWAAYWIPLLALYTGARCSELCQLLKGDISLADGIAAIHINDAAEGQRVKTNAARRSVPLHRELLRLGFLDYVTEAQQGPLWPSLPQREGKPGGFFSQYFGRLKKSHGIRPEVVLHSFRHNVRSALVEALIPESVIDRVMGHEGGGSVGARVYTHIPMTTLRAAVDNLSYPDISLPRLAGVSDGHID